VHDRTLQRTIEQTTRPPVPDVSGGGGRSLCREAALRRLARRGAERSPDRWSGRRAATVTAIGTAVT